MGMKHSVPWVAWAVIPLMTKIFLSLTLALLLKYGGLLPLSNWVLIFLALFVYALSLLSFRYITFNFHRIMISMKICCLSFSLFMSAIFSKATTGALVSLIIYSATFIPFFIIMAYEEEIDLWHKLLAVSNFEVHITELSEFVSTIILWQYLMMSSGFSHAMIYINRFERQGIGLHWYNVWDSPMYYPDREDKTSFGAALLSTFGIAVLYLILAIIVIYIKSMHYFTTVTYISILMIV